MRTIKLETIIDRARKDGIGYAEKYLDHNLTLTGVGLEKAPDVRDMINPSGVLINFLVARKYAGLETILDMDMTPRDFRYTYGFTLFDVRCKINSK